MKIKKCAYLVVLLLTAVVTSCSTTGAPMLSKGVLEKVIEGKTTKSEIANMLGDPQQVMNVNKKDLFDYWYQEFFYRPPAEMFPEDQYEVWTYMRWRYVSPPPPFRSHESEKNGIFIINSSI